MAGRRAATPSASLLLALLRARDRLDHDYAEPLVADDLARAAGCSRFHFQRSFARVYGETPGRLLTGRRIERAQELLRSVNVAVTAVCFAVGFSSLGSFSSRFKAVTGLTPSAYQRAAARRGGPPPVPGCLVLMGSGADRDHPGAAADGGSGAIQEKRRPASRATVLVEARTEGSIP